MSQGRAVLLQLPLLPLCPPPPAQGVTPGAPSAAFGLVSTTSAVAHPTIWDGGVFPAGLMLSRALSFHMGVQIPELSPYLGVSGAQIPLRVLGLPFWMCCE